MAAKEFIIKSELLEGKDIWTKARVVGDDLIALLQADVDGWSLQVFDRDADDSETAIYTFTMTSPSSVVYNTLQLDSSWTRDDIGYNFKHQVDSAAWTQQGGHTYVLEYQLETTAWGPVPVIHHVTIISRHRV